MTERSDKKADTAAIVALLGVILIASIVLATTTDLHVILRAAISIVLGVIAAAVTFVLVKRR